jgi:imidazolonepropionase
MLFSNMPIQALYLRLQIPNMTLLYHNTSAIIQVERENRPYKRGAEMSEVAPLKNGWMLVNEGRIIEIGSGEKPASNRYDEAIDLQGQLVLPTFVDSHTHLVYAANREDEFAQRLAGKSYAEIAAAGGGILNSAKKLAAASEEALFESAQHRLEALIRMGTGALEIKSGYGLSTEAELKILRVARKLEAESGIPIKRTFLGAHAVPASFNGDTDAYVKLVIEEMLPAVVEEGLAHYVDVFCEEGYFSLDQSLAIIEAAEAYGLPAKVHVNQFNSLGAVEAMVDRGALSLDHLEVLSDKELNYIGESQTIATALPGCSLFLNIPYTPGRKLIDANAIFCLATDFNPGSAPSGNMALMMSLACSQMKLRTEEALVAATLNGAAALEMSEDLGSLEVGKWANFMTLEPGYSLASLAYHFGHNLISGVYIKGEKRT